MFSNKDTERISFDLEGKHSGCSNLKHLKAREVDTEIAAVLGTQTFLTTWRR